MKSSKLVILLVFITGFVWKTQTAYLNGFDQPLNFKCPKVTQTVSRVQSVHSNGAEDRRFDISCSDVYPEVDGTSKCYWTESGFRKKSSTDDTDFVLMSLDYVNGYDSLVHFTCNKNYYINGMQSVHSNVAEDRRWKFYCCNMAEIHLSDCYLSGWTNSFDGMQDYSIPSGHVMKGVISRHDNHFEDRLYEYEHCGTYLMDGDKVVG